MFFPDVESAAHAILLQTDEILVKSMDLTDLVTVIRQRLTAGPPILDFRAFLMRHPALYANVARGLSRDYSQACEQLRTLALAASAPAKLARLLLEWGAEGQQSETRLDHFLTHEVSGECIGASRETVTRTLCDFRQRQLVLLHGFMLKIPDRLALEHYAGLTV